MLSGVSLRYGQSYQFRARLTDLTGGGPKSRDPNPSDAGTTTIAFKCFVPPKKVALTLGAVDASGNQLLPVDRPGINYPEMVFAGAADQSTLDALLAVTPPRPIGTPPPADAAPFQAAVLDPDVTTLEIIVEAQLPGTTQAPPHPRPTRILRQAPAISTGSSASSIPGTSTSLPLPFPAAVEYATQRACRRAVQ